MKDWELVGVNLKTVFQSLAELKADMTINEDDTSFRFRNSKYGYCYDRYQKWEQLVVLHTSVEPIGPSYLEAELIEKYRGILDVLNYTYNMFCCVLSR